MLFITLNTLLLLGGGLLRAFDLYGFGAVLVKVNKRPRLLVFLGISWYCAILRKGAGAAIWRRQWIASLSLCRDNKESLKRKGQNLHIVTAVCELQQE